ncbi:MAG: type II toxin-antitoxin system VapC family toxin [Chloroflexota bacterium]
MATVDANAWIATFDPTDVFHAPSVAFFRRVARLQLPIHAPAFLVVEVACALRRKLRDPSIGAQAVTEIRAHPLLRLHALDDVLLDDAVLLGMQYALRGADALYVATARLTQTALVTWDAELFRRAGAVSPADWLDANR